MPRFGWMRLAYLLFVLTILVSLARVGGPNAEASSLAAREPEAPKPPAGKRETPQVTRFTEDVISSLEDIRGSTGRPDVGPNIAEPRLPPVPAEAERHDAVRAQEVPVDEVPVDEVPVDGGPKAPEAAPPVFYRPPDPGAAPAAGPVCGNLEDAPEGGRVVFPLEKRFYYSYEDTWGAPRTQGGHEGTDLMTPSGVPEYAITDGTVVPVAGSDADGWNTLGGYTVMVRADYSIGPIKQGDLFYYAHLEKESALPIGSRVQAGQVVGYAGDTGQGPPATRGLFPPHLHLGWYDVGGAREQADSGAMNPYPLLEWIKANGGAVTGDSEARFCEAQSPAPPIPSGPDEGPANPGISPDLDTGSNDPKPSPAQSDARKENPKPDPAVERRARKQDPPAKKPDRPEEQPQADPSNTPAKPQNSNRPQPANPPKPAEPPKPPVATDTEKPERPAPGRNTSKPSPLEPAEDQYDGAAATAPGPPTGGSEAQTGEPTPSKPPERTARPSKTG